MTPNNNYPLVEQNTLIPSVNFHLWEACNMSCKFCFATFQDVKQTVLPKGHLPKKEAMAVIKKLADYGFQKISFAGGEPTLCPWISQLIAYAKDLGLTTMLVTNGSRLSDDFLKENEGSLDWIAISIDSVSENTNTLIGRAINGTPKSLDYYIDMAVRIKRHGFRFKINTVVNRYNCAEDMNGFISIAKPERWKVLQALPIKGQNDEFFDELSVSTHEFKQFIKRHRSVDKLLAENNKDMIGSYVMIDPAGRFFDNTTGTLIYSKSINEHGVKACIKKMNYSFSKFYNRGGIYNWKSECKDTTRTNRITMSGNVASGKSTVGKILAKRLSFSFISIGEKTRAYAKSQNMSISDFQLKCVDNPSLDKRIDREFADTCNATENLIIDYRLGFHFIDSSLNVFLKVSDNIALERLNNADRENENSDTLHQRNDSFKKQFANSYNIDFTKEENYDLVLSADNKSPNELADIIIRHLYKYAS